MAEFQGNDLSASLQAQVRVAFEAKTPMVIRGGGSKAFYGRAVVGEALEVRGHRGIISYEPTELVLTARAGTPLIEVESVLAAQGQMLPFEPPHFGGGATVGGMVAAGLSGPRRPWAGAVRDAVLGVTVLTGKGEILRFGGQVMKNVAGYDAARLMAGSLGSLGLILDVSIKVLPRPVFEITLEHEIDAVNAMASLTKWQRQASPLSASLHDGERLWLRVSGSEAGVLAVQQALGGDVSSEPSVWQAVRDHQLAFFSSDKPLWRLSLPPAAPALELSGNALVEWGGALRWLKTDESATKVQASASVAGGHATQFGRCNGQPQVFQPLPSPLMALHQRLKRSFDPAGILNPGVLYEGL